MKKNSSSVVLVCVAIALLTAFHPAVFRGHVTAEGIQHDTDNPHAYEELHLALGDVPGDDPDNPSIVRFLLDDVGDAFHIIHGLFLPTPTIDDPDYKPVMMSGTGQVVEQDNGITASRVYYMNLHYSQEHAETDPHGYNHAGMVGQVSLDLATLKGTYWMVGTEYNPNNPQSNEDSTLFDKFDVYLFGELPESLKVVSTSVSEE